MHYLQDDYSHESPDLFYSPRSIPGPGARKEDFVELKNGCECTTNCSEDCAHLASYGINYSCGLLVGRRAAKVDLPVLECNGSCACQPNRCTNRVVQFGPNTNLKVVQTSSKGLGLTATSTFRKGEFVCEYAGEIIDKETALARLRVQEETRAPNYILVLTEHTATQPITTIVDPTVIGNIGRYLNHSCDPNLEMVPVRTDSSLPHLALFAVRYIQEGEELCFDYGNPGRSKILDSNLPSTSNSSDQQISDSVCRSPCYCGAKWCSTFLPFEVDMLLNKD